MVLILLAEGMAVVVVVVMRRHVAEIEVKYNCRNES